MTTIGERLKFLRTTKLNCTQEDFAEKLKVSISTYSRYEGNKFNFNDRIISDICREFNINEKWIRYGDGEIFKIHNTDTIDVFLDNLDLDDNSKSIFKNFLNLDNKKRNFFVSILNELVQKPQTIINTPNNDIIELSQQISLPFYIDLKASAGLGSYLDADSRYEMKNYKINSVTRKADHVIKVNGDSMEPTLKNEDEIFIQEQPAIEYNNIGVFIYDGEIYCKRLIKEKNKIILRSDNVNYKDIIINKNLEFITIGKVLLP